VPIFTSATGSVATEDARFTLLRRALVDVDFWISDKLGRDNSILESSS
jgi:hypothetical protein